MTEDQFRNSAQVIINRQVVDGTECPLPTGNWRCTRGVGHEGPCAAWPVDENGKLLTFDEWKSNG